MKTLLLIFLVFFSFIHAKKIYPTFKLESVGFVNDFIVHKSTIYVANDAGTVDVFDLVTGKMTNQIILDVVVTKMNDLQSAIVLSVDYLNGKLLIVSKGGGSYRNVWIYENFQLKKIIGEDKKLTIKEARFINDEKIILGTFSSEIILHDIGEKYNLYTKHVTQSTLGDITLSEDKKRLIMSDESGEIRVLDVRTSKVLQVHASQNVDNVYHVAHAKNVIITAGQDRRVAVYQKNKDAYHIKSDFLVYCVGISPSAKMGIYSSGEESNLQLFDIKTEKKLDILVGHQALLNQIKFINEHELFSSDRSPYIYYWRLNQ